MFLCLWELEVCFAGRVGFRELPSALLREKGSCEWQNLYWDVLNHVKAFRFLRNISFNKSLDGNGLPTAHALPLKPLFFAILPVPLSRLLSQMN